MKALILGYKLSLSNDFYHMISFICITQIVFIFTKIALVQTGVL